MIKVFEAFSGYGSQSMALKRAEVDFEVVGISEIDKYAIVAYRAVHGDIKNFGDIKLIDEKQLPDFNLFTYSFPCTDISISGKQAGIKEGTRSGLLWECERIISYNKPKFLLMENVKNLVGKKFKPDFDKWCKILEDMGYVNHWQVLNAKEHGIPQNRERVFMISILGGGEFKFPEKEELKIFLKDILEPEVDEKYYLKPEQYSNLLKNLQETGRLNTNPSGAGMNGNVSTGNISPTLTTNKGEGLKIAIGAAQRGREKGQELELNKSEHSNAITTVQKDSLVAEIKQIGNLVEGGNFTNPQRGRVYSTEGVSPTIYTFGGGGLEPKVLEEKKILRYERTEYGKEIRKQYEAGEVEEKIGNMRVPVPREDGISNTLTTVQKDNHLAELKFVGGIGEKDIVGDGKNLSRNFPQGNRLYAINNIANTQTATGGGFASNTGIYLDGIRVRKLTPLECFRLMDVSDEDFYKIQKALNDTFYKGKNRSSSQLYKLAGNSIVVRPLMKIFKNLFN